MKFPLGSARALEGVCLLLAMLTPSTVIVTAFTTSPSIVPRPLAIPQSQRSKTCPYSLWIQNPSQSNRNLPVMEAELIDEDPSSSSKSTRFANPSTQETRKSTDPTPALVSLAQKMSMEPSTAVAAVALAFVLLFSPSDASAAMSGGRMGGSFSSQRSSPTRSMPASSSYGRGYSSGYSSGYGRGYSRPALSVSPYGYGGGLGYGYGGGFSPFGFARPFGFGGPGAIVYNRGPSFFDLLFFGGVAFVIANSIRAASAGNNLMEETSFWSDTASSALGAGTSSVQISVAMEVPDRNDRNSILSVLDRLSSTAKTDSRVGIQNLTSQVALELLRRKSSIVSASTRYKHFGDRNKAQRDFNSVAVTERGKFEQETVSQYGGVDYSQGSSLGRAPSGTKATMAVITIMLAIDGDSTKVPTIRSTQDVEQALARIASDVKVDDCLQGAEILWTPEDPSETLSLREVVADYPDLRSI